MSLQSLSQITAL